MFGAFVLRLAEIFRNRAGEGFMHTELQRAAADAIDAKREIKNGPNNGHQPDDTDPERGGARITFVEQGVNGSEQGSQKIKTRSQMRPEPGNVLEPIHRPPSLWRKHAPMQARSTILWSPSPVLTDTLSPPSGERDGARGASGLYFQIDRPANRSAGVILEKHSRRAKRSSARRLSLNPIYGQATVMSLSR